MISAYAPRTRRRTVERARKFLNRQWCAAIGLRCSRRGRAARAAPSVRRRRVTVLVLLRPLFCRWRAFGRGAGRMLVCGVRPGPYSCRRNAVSGLIGAGAIRFAMLAHHAVMVCAVHVMTHASATAQSQRYRQSRTDTEELHADPPMGCVPSGLTHGQRIALTLTYAPEIVQPRQRAARHKPNSAALARL
jgi:hypothetical protein